MVSEQLVDDFVTLFRGRGDCYGSWDGGCVREALTRQHFREHLGDGPHIGVYPCVPHLGRTMCVWGCTDIDYDGPQDAWLLHDAFEQVNVTSWVERTRRGYHVWVFTDELLLAKDMRRMFLAAHVVTELNPKEVNPKQEQLAQGQVGNYVRLPYPKVGSGQRVVVDRNGDEVPFEQFLYQAMSNRTPGDTIRAVASMYTPPPPPAIEYGEPNPDLMSSVRRLSTAGRAIFRDGPFEGRDRSSALTHLVYECFRANLNPADTKRILEDADLRWGKYLARGPSGMLELDKLLVRVYGHMPSS